MQAVGGSGQGGNYGSGGHAGTLEGLEGYSKNPSAEIATQTSGFAFGYGRIGNPSEAYSGGGGGYWGGGTTRQAPMSANGGSSFISGYPGCIAIKGENDRTSSGQPNHYSGLTFFNSDMKAGNEEMPKPNGTGTMTGNLGHGHIRVNYIEIDAVPPEITLLGDTTIPLEVNVNRYVEPGYIAIDTIDGDVTDKVRITYPDFEVPGLAEIVYTVIDSSGNIGIARRQINIVDTMAPELVGGNATSYMGDENVLFAGLSITDNSDKDILSRVVVTPEIDVTQIGTYTLTYNVTDISGNVAEPITRDLTIIDMHSYTGDYEKFVAPKTGNYEIELWGASGKNNGNANPVGKGAYTKGIISLTKGEILYLYIGESGDDTSVPSALSFNGGGETHIDSPNYGKGGGATDIRLVSGNWKDFDSLKSRIMVAAGRRLLASRRRWRNRRTWWSTRRIRRL